MNKIVKTLVCATAVAAAASADAQFGEPAADADETVETAAGEPAAEEEETVAEDGDTAAKPAVKAPDGKPFHLMPLCRIAEGRCECRLPGAAGWTEVEEGRFYPLGTSFRAVGAESSMAVQFGYESEVVVYGGAAFGAMPAPLGDRHRTIALMSGRITVKLPRNLEPGLFTVTAPGFTACDLAGESRYSYATTGDGDEAVVRCVTGVMAIKGRHFDIPRMTVANELRIRTSQDLLFTGLYGNSGDFEVRLDQGVVSVVDFETKEERVEAKTLNWHLSPKTAVRIHRAKPSIGERMSVTVMTFDANGELKNRCAFAEGRPEINTGEQGVGALAEQDAERQRKAAEAADAVSEEEGDEEEESSEEAPAEEEAGSSGDGDDVF